MLRPLAAFLGKQSSPVRQAEIQLVVLIDLFTCRADLHPKCISPRVSKGDIETQPSTNIVSGGASP